MDSWSNLISQTDEYTSLSDESAIENQRMYRKYGQAPRCYPTKQLTKSTFLTCLSLFPAILLDRGFSVIVQEGSMKEENFECYLIDFLVSQ